MIILKINENKLHLSISVIYGIFAAAILCKTLNILNSPHVSGNIKAKFTTTAPQ